LEDDEDDGDEREEEYDEIDDGLLFFKGNRLSR